MDILRKIVCFIKGHNLKTVNPHIIPKTLTRASLKKHAIGAFYNKINSFPKYTNIEYCKRCRKWRMIDHNEKYIFDIFKENNYSLPYDLPKNLRLDHE